MITTAATRIRDSGVRYVLHPTRGGSSRPAILQGAMAAGLGCRCRIPYIGGPGGATVVIMTTVGVKGLGEEVYA